MLNQFYLLCLVGKQNKKYIIIKLKDKVLIQSTTLPKFDYQFYFFSIVNR